MRSRLVGLVGWVGLVLLAGLVGACGDVKQGSRLVWQDEFDGAAGDRPDPDRWAPQQGGGGWGNEERQCYTDDPANAALDGKGRLVITALRTPRHPCVSTVNDFTSARLTTEDRFEVTYGRLEMRARMPDGQGTWAAFWAMGADLSRVGWPRSGEIDVVEQLGRSASQARGAVHGPRADGSHWYLSRVAETTLDLSAAFHVYAVDWTPTAVTWSVDGTAVSVVSRRQVEAVGGRWVFDKPYFLLLNLAVGGVLGGEPGGSWPQHYVIDYVRVYRHAS